AHLFEGPARPRALGVIGGLTFLGMAAGPFVGAWIIQAAHPVEILDSLGITGGLRDALDAPWRFVFFVNVPIGITALAVGWAGSAGWVERTRAARLDVAGAIAFSIGLGALLVGLTAAGSEKVAGTSTTTLIGLLLATS